MRRRLIALLTLLLLAGLVGSTVLWLRAQQRQYALNRQLITALVEEDNLQALALVKAGADPDTCVKPIAILTLMQCINQVLHHTPLVDHSATAFMMACIATPDAEADPSNQFRLVKTMLWHGATINIQDENGWTPLIVAVGSEASPDLIAWLLQQGANVKAQDRQGRSALSWAQSLGGYHRFPLFIRDETGPHLYEVHGHTPMPGEKELQILSLLKQAGSRK